MMNKFEQYIPWISESWKDEYGAILAEEHLKQLSENIQKFQDKTLEWNLPYFNEEIEINRVKSLICLTAFLTAMILMRLKQNIWNPYRLKSGWLF